MEKCVQSLFSRVQLFVTLWTVTRQAPLSVGFSRQEYWSGLPRAPPGDLLHLGIKSTSLCLLHCRQVLYHQHHLGIVGAVRHVLSANAYLDLS